MNIKHNDGTIYNVSRRGFNSYLVTSKYAYCKVYASSHEQAIDKARAWYASKL